MKPKRYGVRTLAFLTLALLAVLTSNLQHHYTFLTLTVLLVGLTGATISTIRGVLRS